MGNGGGGAGGRAGRYGTDGVVFGAAAFGRSPMRRKERAHVAQIVVAVVRITCKKCLRVGKALVDP